MTPEQAAELRKPFPKSSVGKIPKGGVMLDYVGHAATTDRLLAVDPAWSWEPLALDERGLPALDKSGNLWIRLTVCGVTRIGVGDGKSAKEVIGDALRNAAMRFGVALDLWSKEELEGASEPPLVAANGRLPIPTYMVEAHGTPDFPKLPATATGITKAQLAKLGAQMRDYGLTDRTAAIDFVTNVIGRPVASRSELSRDEASAVIDDLAKRLGELPEDGS